MKLHFIRLTKGQDLKKEIQNFCLQNNIFAGVVISSVGCLDECLLRNAGASEILKIKGPLEIISLNGTVSSKRIHLHLIVSDKSLKVYGGHLVEGSIINTTCELGILESSEYIFLKEFDSSTGYNEIVFKKRP